MKIRVKFPGHVAHGKVFEAVQWKSHPNSPPCEGWALTCDGCDYVLPFDVCRPLAEEKPSGAWEPFGPVVEGYLEKAATAILRDPRTSKRYKTRRGVDLVMRGAVDGEK